MTLPRVMAEGNHLATSRGPIVLRGVNVADPKHICEKRRATIQEVISIATDPPVLKDGKWEASIHEGGFGSNVVRLPILPDAFWEAPDTYIEEYLAPAVEACDAAGSYAIIDCHYVADSPDYVALKPDIERFWSIVAPRFASYNNVIYEPLNEPVKPRGWEQFRNTFAQPIVDLIRQSAANTLTLVGGTYYNDDVPLAVEHPIDDDNIAYVVHSYPEHYPPIQDQLEPLTERFPVFVTEWGYEQGIDREDRPAAHSPATTRDFGKPWLEFMEAKGLSWTAWILDPLWTPRIVTYDWYPTYGHGRMGQFLIDQLPTLNGKLPEG